MMLKTLLTIVALSLTGIAAAAHEFWVDPQRYTLKPGEQIIASLRVGQMMRGAEIPYLTSRRQSFTVATRAGVSDIGGQEGDIPALSYTVTGPGLHVITYHSMASELIYESWEKFLNTLRLEGAEELAQMHRDRGLPEKDFKETYIRYAKALVQVGPVSADDHDIARNAPLELVAAENPYTPELEKLTVTLLRFGRPVAGRQIVVFRSDDEVTRTTVTTDTQGQAEIPISKGGKFLLNAVDFQPVADADAVWESYWASLRFGLPITNQIEQQ